MLAASPPPPITCRGSASAGQSHAGARSHALRLRVIIALTVLTLGQIRDRPFSYLQDFSAGYRKLRVGTSIAFPPLSGLSARF